ncbi:MAG TPA: hypothetical protein PKW71_05465, partial [Anaerohalosphaeraceae bacterium]|nr:hypothetical protein [Anaerohalosphaeraceae bacterium]
MVQLPRAIRRRQKEHSNGVIVTKPTPTCQSPIALGTLFCLNPCLPGNPALADSTIQQIADLIFSFRQWWP